MNFGLTVLTLFYIIIIIIPGVVFKRFFYQNNPTKQSGVGNFGDRILTSIFCGIIIQIIATFILTAAIDQIWGYSYEYCFKRINNIHNSLVKNELPIVSPTQLTFIVVSIILANSLAMIIGVVLYKLIRAFKFDVKYPVLRFDSDWKYIFRDETKIFEDNSLKKFNEFDAAKIDALVKDNAGGTYLYSGILHDYSVDKYGQLVNISLIESIRFKRESSDSPTNKKSVPGHLVILPYSNILNLNITYVYRIKRSKNRLIESSLYILLFLVLLVIFIAPWFSNAIWYYKIISIILLIISWMGAVGLSTSLLGKTKEPVNATAKLILFTILVAPLYFGLKLLGVDILKILFTF